MICRKLACFFLVFVLSVSWFSLGVSFVGCSGESWLTDWTYRKSHVIGQTAGAGSDYQVNVTVHYGLGSDSGSEVYASSHCNTSFGDVRFTEDDGVTLLDFWIEDKVDSNYAFCWVEVSDDLSIGDVTIYIYYGNDGVSYPFGADQSEMDATFIFSDHFYGSGLNASKWSDSGSGISVGGSEVVVSGANWIRSVSSYGQLKAFFGKVKSSGSGARNLIITNIGYTNYVDYYTLGADFRYGLCKGGVAYASNYAGADTVYYDYEIRRINGSLVSFFVDGGLVVRYVNPTYIPIVDMYFELSRWLAGSVTADYVFVRKCVDLEPVHGVWGSEEEYSVGNGNGNGNGEEYFLFGVLLAGIVGFSLVMIVFRRKIER